MFFIRSKGGSKERTLSAQKCGRSYELLVPSTDALSLSYRILVSAKATKLDHVTNQGHLANVFCKISPSEKQILLKIFCYLGTAKNF